MTPQARVQAAIEILDGVIAAARDDGPAADTIVAGYFKTRRYAGSKDRRAVRDHVYDAIRTFATPPESGRAAMIALARREDSLAKRDDALTEAFDGSPHGPAQIGAGDVGADEVGAKDVGLPSWLRDRFPVWFDNAEAAALLGRAPLDLRVNALKADAASIRDEFPEAEPIAWLPNALRLPPGTRVEDSAAYRDGRVEIQDAGSQTIVAACAARPGETVIDLCAGAGGKTLALAADMRGADGAMEGALIACDAIRARLAPLPDRAYRAGAKVETRLLDMGREGAALGDLVHQADLVLIDAPCSGTGTWRRNPDGRWRITADRIARFAAEQARLLDLATYLVRPGGRIVYAVCSLVEAEGPNQIAAFLSRHSQYAPHPASDTGRAGGGSSQSSRVLTPAHDGCDGFFFAALRRDGPSA